MALALRSDFVEQSQTDTEELDKVKKWLYDAERSTTETEWRATADEDYKFYSGDQDTDEVRIELQNQHRPVTVANEVKPKVDMLVGLAAQTKHEPIVVPIGAEDEALAELMGGVYKHFVKKTKFMRRLLECFEHTVKSGRSLLYFYIDKQNPFNPEIKIRRIDGRSFILDPEAMEYDLSDARYVFIDTWLTKEQIQTMWPDFDPELSGTTSLSDNNQPVFFNEDMQKFRVVECWYKKYVKVVWFINPLTRKPESLSPEDFKKFAKVMAEGKPELGIQPSQQPIQSVGSIKEEINYLIFCGNFKLEGGVSPYRWKGFPCAFLGAYKNDITNSWFGVVTTMKDPQRSKNTMIRQLSHLLQTLPKGILVHEAGAVLNIDEYEERSSSPNFHLELAQGGLPKIQFMTQPQISPIYLQLEQMFSQAMKDASGIQDTLMGVQTSSREPGVTVAKRQETGLAVLYTLFDNFAETRLQAGRILLSLISQYVSAPTVIRIEGPVGMQLMQINTQSQRDNQGFNDISTGEFDLTVDDSIETESSRLLIAQILADYARNNPGIIPPDVVLEYSNVPYTVKQRVLQTYIQQMQQQQQNIEAQRQLEIMKVQATVENHRHKMAVEEKAIDKQDETNKEDLRIKEKANEIKAKEKKESKNDGK